MGSGFGAMAKRVVLFLIVNFFVVITLSILANVLGLNRHLYANGLDMTSLMGFCLVWGMGGAFISLLLSRVMAKWMMGVQVIDPATQDPAQRQLVSVVYRLAQSAGLTTMPEVGYYESPEVNAFATGPTKSRALVAVSTGLLHKMNAAELEGVLGHEISHVANGDMVTMTLIQGVINAFVMFLSRIAAFFLSQALRGDRDDDRPAGSGWSFFIFQFIFEIVFMLLGSIVVAWFSRWREYRADAGSALIAGRAKMISALEALRRNQEVADADPQPAIQSLKISSGKGFLNIFATHPPLEDRIAALQKMRDPLGQ